MIHFVSVIYLHADIPPHLTQLSKPFQRENVSSLVITKFASASLRSLLKLQPIILLT